MVKASAGDAPRKMHNLVQAMAFAWIDTLQARRAGSVAFALLNDSEQPVGSSVLDALEAWDIEPVVWSRRADVAERLAAQES